MNLLKKLVHFNEPKWEFLFHFVFAFLLDKMLWFLPFLVVSQLLGLNLSLPTGNGNAAAFRSKNNAGVALNNRKKVHGEGEKCPRQSTTHCTCRSKKSGLDITCEDVDTDELHEFAKILKSSSTDHLIRYFKIRNSNIPHLDDYLFMGMKIEHLYIHDCSKYKNILFKIHSK